MNSTGWTFLLVLLVTGAGAFLYTLTVLTFEAYLKRRTDRLIWRQLGGTGDPPTSQEDA